MNIMNELIVSVVGGVATALILALMTGSKSKSAPPTQIGNQVQPARSSSRSIIGDFFRIILAVTIGIGVALIGGRILIQAGILPAGLPSRLILLVVATALCWLLLVGARRR